MHNSIKNTLTHNGQNYSYVDIAQFPWLSELPVSLRILFENSLRKSAPPENTIAQFQQRALHKNRGFTLAFYPSRILMQDFTGVPAIADLAALREAYSKKGSPADRVNPKIPVDLVVDHSVQVHAFGTPNAYAHNLALEYEQNKERYSFLKWAEQAFKNVRIVPPGAGICHQVNLECLASVVHTNNTALYPDTLLGTDSHTTMINALGVLGWGVGGIEAEAAMLGEPVMMDMPEVVGVELVGELPAGVTATDLILTITQRLRHDNVVGCFVEYFGSGVPNLTLADRATIANMAPEYGATCGFFAVDDQTLKYLHLTGRSPHQVDLVEKYTKTNGLWGACNNAAVFDRVVKINLHDVRPSLAGPKRPQDKVLVEDLPAIVSTEGAQRDKLSNGSVVLAAITSCTNTSNPSVMLAAGLVAKKAVELGLKTQPWVKTSLAPGSKVVTSYLEQSGLQHYLEALGFHTVGYGCTTCIGNSGPLPEAVEAAIQAQSLTVASVLSGNRNFEGRIHPLVKNNFLASPPLVVLYALAGTTNINLLKEPLGYAADGTPIYMQDIWPSSEEIQQLEAQHVSAASFQKKYSTIFEGDKNWQQLESPSDLLYAWDKESTYIQKPPFADLQHGASSRAISQAHILALLDDSVTTDHISPAGAIKPQSPAGAYLRERGITPAGFNSYGARRGNHEVMVRGTFANIRLQNQLTPGVNGGYTKNHLQQGEVTSIYEAAQTYAEHHIPLVVMAGREYGTGSSRDWAAKGTNLLGIQAVIAKSFERIHRSNLIGMGVLPLVFKQEEGWRELGITGKERLTIKIEEPLYPRCKAALIIKTSKKETRTEVECAIYTEREVEWLQAGGVLPYVLQRL